MRCTDADRLSADDAVDVSATQVGHDGDEQGDGGAVKLSVDAHDRWFVGGRFNRRSARPEFLLADRAGDVGMADGVAAGGLYAAAGLLSLATPSRPRPVDDTNRAERHSMWRDAADGARWIRGQQLLLGLAITGGLASALT